jgi:hypothetical protein
MKSDGEGIQVKQLFALVFSFAALAAMPALASGGPDALWEVTVKMDMPGMPMSMPPQTSKICVEKSKEEKTVPMDKNCQMLDFKRSGLKTSYRFKCTGEMAMTGSGEVTWSTDGNSYKGKMDARGSMEGRPFEMKQEYSAKRAGSCTAGEEKKKVEQMQAQNQKNMDDMCTPPPDAYNLQWQMYEKNQVCAKYRPLMCKRAKEISQELSTSPEKYAELKPEQEQWGESLQKCGINPDKIAPPCKQAVAKKNWQFVADYCPAEGKKIAAKECAGRDYTAAMESEYAPVCMSFAKENVGKSQEGKKKGNKEEGNGSVKDEAVNKLKGGLKGMFGF